MKAMISMPMGGKTKEEIDAVFERAKAIIEKRGYEVVDTRFHFDHEQLKEAGVKNIPLMYLAKSLEVMSKVDMVFFLDGWKDARGCCIEHEAVVDYQIHYIQLVIADED